MAFSANEPWDIELGAVGCFDWVIPIEQDFGMAAMMATIGSYELSVFQREDRLVILL